MGGKSVVPILIMIYNRVSPSLPVLSWVLKLSTYLAFIPWIWAVRPVFLGHIYSHDIYVTCQGSSFLLLSREGLQLFLTWLASQLISAHQNSRGLLFVVFGLARILQGAFPFFLFLSISIPFHPPSRTRLRSVAGFPLLIYAWGKAAAFQR